MSLRRSLLAILATISVTATAIVIATTGGESRRVPRAAGEARGAAQEAEEQRETTELRLDALRRARRAGLFGQREPIQGAAAPGWAGEQLMNVGTDDWEPAIAADPKDPFVYIITTRYGQPKPCSGNCPVPHIALEISSDGGKTWSDGRPLCACKGSGQFDPIIEVVPDTGDVYAMYMNGFNVVFVKSTDHGQTWSAPVKTYGNVSWNDKPAFAVSDDGRDVYVSWNGPTGGDPWVAQSHNGGETWKQTKIVDGHRYFFAFDADVLSDGTVVFSESSFDYSGPAASAVGQIRHHAFISRNGGRSWETHLIDAVEIGAPCVSDGCYADFYGGRNAVSADPDGDLVYLYDGASTQGGPQTTYARRSTDGGLSWSDRVPLSVAGKNATSPAVEFGGDDDVRAFYFEQGVGSRWNVFYRSSGNGGRTWTAAVKISDATSGADYKNAEGFLEVYGDYGEIAVTSSGKSIPVWGEGFSWIGPGGTWFNRET